MAYTPTTWTTGDTITASAMNKIENGIAGAGSAMIVDSVNNTLNKTVQEIYDALEGGMLVYLRYYYGDVEVQDYVAYRHLAPITMVYRYSTGDPAYRVAAISASNNNNFDKMTPSVATFGAEAIDEYPVLLYWVAGTQSSVTVVPG